MFNKLSGLIGSVGWGSSSGSVGVQNNNNEYPELSARLAKSTKDEAQAAEQAKTTSQGDASKAKQKVVADSYSNLIEKFNALKASDDDYTAEFQDIQKQLVNEFKKYDAQIKQLKAVLDAVDSGALEMDEETVENNRARLAKYEEDQRAILRVLKGEEPAQSSQPEDEDDGDGEVSVNKNSNVQEAVVGDQAKNPKASVQQNQQETLLSFSGKPLVSNELTDADLINNPKKRLQFLNLSNLQLEGIKLQLAQNPDPAREEALNFQLKKLEERIALIQEAIKKDFESKMFND